MNEYEVLQILGGVDYPLCEKTTDFGQAQQVYHKANLSLANARVRVNGETLTITAANKLFGVSPQAAKMRGILNGKVRK